MILIITNKEDVTTDFIIKHLEENEFYRFNTEDFIHRVNITIDISNNRFFLHDKIDNKIINSDDIFSIYYRRPKFPNFNYAGLTAEENNFVHAETENAIKGIFRILEGRLWISNPFSIAMAENKIYQMVLAQKIGFLIPRSLITNIKTDFETFLIENEKQCIVKTIKNGFVDDKKTPSIIFTSDISNITEQEKSGIEKCPTYVQEKIKKEFDIRCIVVGDKVFGAKIDSQIKTETEIDWRKGYNIDLKHEKIELPFDIVNMCIQITRLLDLSFGAIDLVKSKNGKYVFLEINPNGQWAWLEKRLEYNISGHIANLLKAEGRV